jgi:hypothetical protein
VCNQLNCTTMTRKSKKPLPLSDILRDLALLRASSHGIPELFITTTSESQSVAASYNYVATIRAAIELNDSGKLGAGSKRIEAVCTKCEELDVCDVAFLAVTRAQRLLVHTSQTRAR